MEYLAYIDQFTIAIFYLVEIMIFVLAMVYWFAKGFAWFINQVFDLKKSQDRYDYISNK